MARILQKRKREERQAVFNATGNATAVVTVPLGPSWEVQQIGVKTGPMVNHPQCATYVGQNTAGVFISNTLIGDADTDSMPNVTVRAGDSICAVWALGTPGVVATMTVIYDEVAY